MFICAQVVVGVLHVLYLRARCGINENIVYAIRLVCNRCALKQESLTKYDGVGENQKRPIAKFLMTPKGTGL